MYETKVRESACRTLFQKVKSRKVHVEHCSKVKWVKVHVEQCMKLRWVKVHVEHCFRK